MFKLLLYFYTLKYLKISQVYHRIIKRFNHPKAHFPVCDVVHIEGEWVTKEIHKQKLMNEIEVEFLNHQGTVNCPSDWNKKNKEKLWLYNLHYFDDLNSVGSFYRKDLQLKWINKWILQNPAISGGNGWEAYTLSLRIVNWIKAFLSGLEVDDVMLNSLAQQADFLSQDLEKHLLGNHYFVNLKALIFAGCFFKGADATKWLTIALIDYEYELKEQVLNDGGSFELSPMYHAIMLTDLLDLFNLFKAFPDKIPSSTVELTQNKIKKMLSWLNAMSHSDGKISFFNDSAFGIAPEISRVFNYADQLGVNVTDNSTPISDELLVYNLPDTGYVSVKSDSFSLIADLAEVGPTYQPGHAHADTLSFELALFDQRIFVNSGISEYGLNKERVRQRKTAAHNTVTVNELDSSQVWSGFRVAKRANIIEKNVTQTEDGFVCFSASHNGFQQQGVNCIHKRSWMVQPQMITVSDSLIGKYENACGYLHLHPNVNVIELSNKEVKLAVKHFIIFLIITDAEVTIENTTWHPEFGVTLINKKLCLKFIGNTMNFKISWYTI